MNIKRFLIKIQLLIENNLKHDKLVHFFIGTLVSLLIYFFILKFNMFKLSLVMIPLLVSILKELFDKYIKKTNFDIIDILFTIIASVILFLIIW